MHRTYVHRDSIKRRRLCNPTRFGCGLVYHRSWNANNTWRDVKKGPSVVLIIICCHFNKCLPRREICFSSSVLRSGLVFIYLGLFPVFPFSPFLCLCSYFLPFQIRVCCNRDSCACVLTYFRWWWRITWKLAEINCWRGRKVDASMHFIGIVHLPWPCLYLCLSLYFSFDQLCFGAAEKLWNWIQLLMLWLVVYYSWSNPLYKQTDQSLPC